MSVEVKGMKTSTERTGSSFSGYPILALILALLLLVAWNLSGNFNIEVFSIERGY